VRHLATRPPLRRLFWALARLRSGRPLKARDLAEEFEVNVRTAYRDLDFLRDEWRVSLEFDRAKGSYTLGLEELTEAQETLADARTRAMPSPPVRSGPGSRRAEQLDWDSLRVRKGGRLDAYPRPPTSLMDSRAHAL
jgi:hypothetical protein